MPLRPVYRPILRKNERQGSAVFDVLACNHAVLVDDSARANTYRRARACPECAAFVARFVAENAPARPQAASIAAEAATPVRTRSKAKATAQAKPKAQKARPARAARAAAKKAKSAR